MSEVTTLSELTDGTDDPKVYTKRQMKDVKNEGFANILIAILILCFVAFLGIKTNSVRMKQINSIRSQAVNRGYAEWLINDTGNGESTFTWKDNMVSE